MHRKGGNGSFKCGILHHDFKLTTNVVTKLVMLLIVIMGTYMTMYGKSRIIMGTLSRMLLACSLQLPISSSEGIHHGWAI